MFGKDAPFQITDLPVQSQLRQRLESLPGPARQRAMSWLHSFAFPENDLESLQVDDDGGVFYSDTQKPKPVSGEQITASSTALTLPAVDTFQLHSRPGASKKVFLDFDGHVISGTAWNGSGGTLNAVAFDLVDPDKPGYFPTNFSSDERNRIAETWHRIAEDLAPFDIDVTTEEPASFGPTVGRILFTRDTDANGLAMPSKGAGGVAYVNVWGLSTYSTSYSPALVYYNNLGPNHPPFMAEAGAHEFGHNLGLSHDGVLDGTQNPKCLTSTGYYCGLGSGYVSWAPIMGVGYYTNVTEWSKGEYPSANNTQDDMSIIGGKLQYRSDDRSNILTGATPLAVEVDGGILVTNPQNDPANIEFDNKGIIETRSDVDMFWFDAAAGSVNITVTPAWAAYYRTSARGANLDIEAKLYNQSGIQIAGSDPSSDTNATIAATVSAGRYYLAVAGIGNSITPYSDYGSLGEYFISGNVPPSATDTTPPTPNPMGWASLGLPDAQGSKNSVAMTATTATDASGGVEYQFRCVAGGPGCVNSAWQTSSSYLATGLAASTSYSFSVVARDLFGNTTAASSPIVVAVTAGNQPPLATNDSATLNEDGTVTISVLSNDSDPDADNLTVSSTGPAAKGAVTNNGNSITYKPTANYYGSDSFSYTVSDGFGGIATANVTVTVNAVNDAPLAIADSSSVSAGKSITIGVLANDSDIDQDPITPVSTTPPSKGSAMISGNSVIYTAGNKIGTDTFSYTIGDGHGGKATATISVTLKRR
jgi:hypothetical protein